MWTLAWFGLEPMQTASGHSADRPSDGTVFPGRRIHTRSVHLSIVETAKLKLKDKHVESDGQDIIYVYPPNEDKQGMFFSLQTLRKMLPHVIVKGIPTVSRAVINNLDDGAYASIVCVIRRTLWWQRIQRSSRTPCCPFPATTLQRARRGLPRDDRFVP
jgi:hypothetical protein